MGICSSELSGNIQIAIAIGGYPDRPCNNKNSRVRMDISGGLAVWGGEKKGGGGHCASRFSIIMYLMEWPTL